MRSYGRTPWRPPLSVVRRLRRSSLLVSSTTSHNRGLRIISQSCEEAEHEPPVRRRGVDRRALAGEHA
jgi:hypothetical protein